MIRPEKRRRKPRPVVCTMGYEVSAEEATAFAATVFQGELMVCALCDAQERSNPETNTGWRALELEGKRFYVCARHFPPDGSPAAEFTVAYAAVLLALYAEFPRPAHDQQGAGNDAQAQDDAGPQG